MSCRSIQCRWMQERQKLCLQLGVSGVQGQLASAWSATPEAAERIVQCGFLSEETSLCVTFQELGQVRSQCL